MQYRVNCRTAAGRERKKSHRPDAQAERELKSGLRKTLRFGRDASMLRESGQAEGVVPGATPCDR
jgi:hypothetical protein